MRAQNGQKTNTKIFQKNSVQFSRFNKCPDPAKKCRNIYGD